MKIVDVSFGIFITYFHSLLECENGEYGFSCKQNCPNNCPKSCDKKSGECTESDKSRK